MRPPILLTFLEDLRVQGVKRVQALPGIWGLLSTNKQKLREEQEPSPPELTKWSQPRIREAQSYMGEDLSFWKKC